MRLLNKIILVSTLGATVLSASATDIFEKIAKMNKGSDGYVIGKTLSQDQLNKANANQLKSEDPKVMKFLDGDNLLIAVNSSNNKVIAINKRFSQIDSKEIKGMIGNMIHDFDEPTAMAHNKMIYWVFDEKGKKISEDDLKAWKDQISGKVTEGMALAEAVNVKKPKVEFNPYISVKLQSDQPMMGENKDEKEPKLANAYLMISSDKLIKATTGIK